VPPAKSPGRDHARAELLTEGGDKLTLALLVLRVLLVDNVDFAVPANDLVVRAALLDAGTNLHESRVVNSKMQYDATGRSACAFIRSLYITLCAPACSLCQSLVPVHNPAFGEIIGG